MYKDKKWCKHFKIVAVFLNELAVKTFLAQWKPKVYWMAFGGNVETDWVNQMANDSSLISLAVL